MCRACPATDARRRAATSRARWVAKGFNAIKFAAAVSDDGIVEEMAALREAVGPDVKLMVDLHWKFTAGEAIRLIRRLEPYDLYFAEAPCAAGGHRGPGAGRARHRRARWRSGEEWRTVFEYRAALRGARHRCRSSSPRWATPASREFLPIGAHGACLPCRHDPACHASASASSWPRACRRPRRCRTCRYHEYQHSIFDKNLRYVTGDMACEDGFYTVPTGPGLGVEPQDAVFECDIG